MAQPIKIEASLEGKLFVSIGSFWSDVFKEKDKVRVLVETALRTKILGELNNAVQNFAGDQRLASLRRHEFVSFEQNDVIETGMQVFDGDPYQEYGLNNDAGTAYNSFRIRYWALPLKNIIPVALQAKDKQLLVGVDFFIQANRYIYFREDPRELFPAGGYLVVRGYEPESRSYLSYFTQTHAPGADDLVVKYFRVSQTPQYFKLALAAVGRLGIIRHGGKLLAITRTSNSTDEVVYVFPDEAVRVDYQHEPLVIGNVYPPLTVIGDVIRVLQSDRKQAAWWRQIDWRGGLTLDPISRIARGVPLVDAWKTAYVAGQDQGSAEGSKVHAQIQLGGDPQTEAAFWAMVKENETRNGYYLNSVIGLPNEGGTDDPTIPDTYAKMVAATEEANALNFQLGLDPELPAFASLPGSKQVNPLDIFFKAVLNDVGYIIAFDMRQLKYAKDVFDFLTREMPVGCCPVIMGFVPNVIDDFDTFDGTVLVQDTVAISSNLLIQVEEAVDGSHFEHEFVNIVPQFQIL